VLEMEVDVVWFRSSPAAAHCPTHSLADLIHGLKVPYYEHAVTLHIY
jgi:hypothetical protein